VSKKVYIPNTDDSMLIATTPIDIYDSELDSWSRIELDTPQRKYNDVVSYKGFIYLVGGLSVTSSDRLSDVIKYYIGD